MLNEEERREIEVALQQYDQKRAGGIDALKIVQRRRGWISDQDIAALADFLEMSEEELDNVATFYNLLFRQPVGRHVIYICDSVSCWIMGYEHLRERLSASLEISLGQTTADDRFTLLPIQCLGTCDHAPAMIIDEELYQDLDQANIDEILERYP